MNLVITCEHGGNEIPTGYASLFATSKAQHALASHRGYDPGTLTTARRFASLAIAAGSPRLHVSTVSRLLIDLNRSLDHKDLFSEFSQDLSSEAKQVLIDTHYAPYRERVTREIQQLIETGSRVIHVSVHSFTPVFAGQSRGIDIGWLFDPSRRSEVAFCDAWIHRVQAAAPRLRLRRNAPYEGTSDGFTTALRQQFTSEQYAGIELELSQGISRREKSLAVLNELVGAGLQGII